MNVVRALLMSALAVGATTANAHHRVSLGCKGASRGVEVALPAAKPVIPQVDGQGDAWLEIEEHGADLTVSGAPAEAFEVTVPPRYGRFFLPLAAKANIAVSRSEPSRARSTVRFRLDCALSESKVLRLNWYRRAAEISRSMLPVPSGVPMSEMLAHIGSLAGAAPDLATSALAVHLEAQALFTSDRTVGAVNAFSAAEIAWAKAGDPSRALVAHVGRLEELNRAGRYAEVLSLPLVGTGLTKSDEYFATRETFPRCLALRDIGRLMEAEQCYSLAINMLTRLSERAEASGLGITRAYILDNLGDAKSAVAEARRARRLAAGPDAPLLRGRADLLLYDLLLDRGMIEEALKRMESALAEFASVRAARWEANAMLRAAWIYAQFGSVEEAKEFTASAMARLSEKDAPARVAAAHLVSAEVHRRAGDNAEALASVRAAEALYDRLGMARQADESRLLESELLLDGGDVPTAKRILARLGPTSGPGRQFCEARIKIAEDDLGGARAILNSLSPASISLLRGFDLIALQAKALALSGARAEALGRLRSAASRIRARARACGNPLLADLLMRKVLTLRSVAVEILLDNIGGAKRSSKEADVAESWVWAMLSEPLSPETRDTGVAVRAADFDRAVASELLVAPFTRTDPERATSARAMLDMIAVDESASAVSEEPLFSPRDLQNQLNENAVFVTMLGGATGSLMLWMNRHDVRIAHGPGLVAFRRAKDQLLGLVGRRDSQISAIQASAEALSSDLLTSASDWVVPSEVFVDNGSELADIPWPLLRFPNAKGIVVTHADVSLMQVSNSCCTRGGRGKRMQIFVAKNERTSPTGPELPVAMMEEKAIAAAVAPMAVVTKAVHRRQEVLDLLKIKGGWVHFAAHGRTVPARFGVNGIWISGNASVPAFLSGIDVLGQAVGSDLVVLGTCESARKGRQGEFAAFSFADAVSRSGARSVVAAAWPISDSAAAIWVPVFYREAAQSHRFANALRLAQLALQSTRAFRHPYYWGSLVHLERLETARVAQ